jgi:membrane associated rhomboid family serine protease
MGSADRHYWREDPPSRRVLGAQQGWSATTWLIILCVGVFVADAFLPRQWVVIQSQWEASVPVPVQRDILSGVRQSSTGPISEDPTRTPIAEQTVFAPAADGSPVPVAVNTVQSMPFLQRWLYFSTSTALYSTIPGVGVSALQVWRFIGFQFCHADLNHLIFNMIGLYFFGPIVERYLGAKRFTAFYLLCGIAGALLYLMLNLAGYLMAAGGGRVVIPGLLLNDPDMPLVGASAGVFGVIIASARLMPDAQVLLFFVIPMRLKTLAYGLVLLACAAVLLRWSNAGGEAAHIGGAVAGWYLIHNPDRLRSFFDLLGTVDPTSTFHSARRVQRAGLARGESRQDRSGRASAPSSGEVDRILDKIRSTGLGSLTESERRTLRDATHRDG